MSPKHVSECKESIKPNNYESTHANSAKVKYFHQLPAAASTPESLLKPAH